MQNMGILQEEENVDEEFEEFQVSEKVKAFQEDYFTAYQLVFDTLYEKNFSHYSQAQ